MNGRIIVGVDGSGPSSAALSWAVARSAATRIPVVVVNVSDEADDAEATALLAESAAAARALIPQLEISTQRLHGAASRELAAFAAPQDLLVVGTHKTGYLNGRVLGTRGIAVTSAAPCSVVIVPAGPLTGRSGILVGVSGDTSHDAVVAGAREAARLREELTLLNATSSPDEGRVALADAAAVALVAAPGLAVRSRLSRRRPAEALLDASRSASLLVIGGSHSDSDHLGSVSYEVLLNINTTVMVARQ